MIESILFFLTGDVMTGRGIDQVLPHSVEPVLYEPYVTDARDYVKLAEREHGAVDPPLSYNTVWGAALLELEQRRPDFRIINLETGVTTHPEPWPGKDIHYRMHPHNVELLTTIGIDVSVLANNHVLDWGRPGLEQTLDVLERAGIKTAGAGLNSGAAAAPATLAANGVDVRVYAYGFADSGVPAEWRADSDRSGVNYIDAASIPAADRIADHIEKTSNPGDVIVVSLHWGDNWGYDVPRAHMAFAHALIDRAGVDVIHGHSSHHPRPMEIYRGKLILYGAGDFINDYEGIGGHEAYRGDLALMYFPRLDSASGDLQALTLVPLQIKNLTLHRPPEADVSWLLKTLNRISGDFGLQLERDRPDNSLVWK